MRAGGERRGNNRDRRARKVWMLATFDPELGPDQARCRLGIHERCCGLLDMATVTADRIDRDGPYVRSNVQPACHDCQRAQGGRGAVRFMAPLLEEYRAAREQWEIRFDLETNRTYYPGVIELERHKEKRGGRREVTDWVFSEWLAQWHAARRESEAS